MVTDLLIVARNQQALHTYLKQDFANDDDVEVIVDRRTRDRRRAPGEGVAHERRRGADRRRHPDLREKLTTVGFAVVRLDAPPA